MTNGNKNIDISEYIQIDDNENSYIDLENLVNNSVIEEDKKYILRIEINGKIVEKEVQYYNGPL